MKILHAVPYFPPDRLGGVGEVARHLHRGLLGLGHDSTVITAGRGADDPTVRRIAASPLGWLATLPRAASRVRDHDIVHCHSHEAFPLMAVLKLARSSVPIVVTYHSSSAGIFEADGPFEVQGRWIGEGLAPRLGRSRRFLMHRIGERAASRLADQAVFVARSAAVDVLGPERAVAAPVIHNGIELPAAGGAGRRTGPELLFVGRAGALKRAAVLPAVLERVRQSVAGVRLQIVGLESEREPSLMAEFVARGLGDVVASVGPVPSTELVRFYCSARLVIFPSAYEGLPMTILEAMGHGLPVVATRVGGVPEAVEDGVNGFLVERDEVEALAGCCIRILEDPELSDRMGEAGRRTVAARFSVERMVSQYVALYRAVVERKRASAQS